MAINCNSKNPLQRDGTSQAQRILKTLLPGYVAVDERNIEDLKAFAKNYAREIAFYNLDNKWNADPLKQDWFGFFDKTTDSGSRYNAPHFVLFMAFLDIFRHAQDEINKLTKKHLDFYYRDVLHLKEKPAVPGQVYLIFELAKHTTKHTLKKDTLFKAGKDALGNNVSYKLEKEASLNIATVSELKAVFTNKYDIFSGWVPYPKNNYRIYVSPQANSEDGNGADLTNEDKSWRTFGGIKFTDISLDMAKAAVADRGQAEIGFALASPNLFLAEGERIVTLFLKLSSPKSLLNNLTDELMYDAFRLKFSGEEKWIRPVWETTSSGSGTVDSITALRILDFLNKAASAAQIAGIEPAEGPVKDDPSKGYGDQRKDYDIGLTVAQRIIAERNKLPSKKFTGLDQVRAIKYVGKDKIDDLIYSFGGPVHHTTIDKANNRIIIKRTITRDQEAIVAYNKKALSDPFETKWPVVKVLLNTAGKSDPYIYQKLKSLQIAAAHIVVDVREVKNLVIQNDRSVLDPGKPFQPFGNRPLIGSNFYIGSHEIFQKALNELKINIKWFGLPDDNLGFTDYYSNYYPNLPARTNTSFEVKTGLLDKKDWTSVDAVSKKLFTEESSHKLKAGHSIVFSNSDPAGEPPKTLLGNVERDETLKPFDEFDQASQKGFVRLSLSGTDFGHREYQTAYTKAVLIALNPPATKPPPDYSDKLPNEPYTPEIEELSLNYVASEEVITKKVSGKDYKKRVEQFFHVHPTGTGEMKTTASSNYLLPQYDNEGELYIGIKDLKPPQNLSVLFQIAEGTSDPDLIPPKIKWSYLADDQWTGFPKQNILSDSTKGLITTGVILFDIPKRASDTNTILTKGLYWIRATAEHASGGIPQLIDIKCQAAKVVFDGNNNDPEYLAKPMAEKTISKPVNPDSSIKKIEQPFTSFGGKVQEESDAFYTRVSERLRHKNRSITIWDYERIVLQNFPSVYKVKCLNHTSYTGTFSGINEAAPGHVSLIIVSNIRNKNAVNPLKPRTSLVTLFDIEKFISGIRSPYIKLHVHNPLFEEVQVKFNVRFHEGLDKGIHQVKLEESLIRFLSPWAFETGSDIVFGGKIHKSVILNFVEEQEYVDYITCFEMFHVVPDDPANDPLKDVDEAIASTSASVLGSKGTHIITVLETEEECECPDNEVKTVETASADDCPCD